MADLAKGVPTRTRTVASIMSAGWELFASKGFHATSIDQICSAAALSRGTFYLHFKNKEALFLALFEQHAEREVARIESAVTSTAGDVDAALLSTLESLFANSQESRQWAMVSTEFTLAAARDPALAERLTAFEDALATRLESALAPVLERSGAEADRAALLPTFIVALHEGLMLQQVVTGDRSLTRAVLTEFLPQALGPRQ
ncbi:TetR/AcrR family transcriptional regulator [Gordonia sp. PDNC005]|uniref:TetR/AcrR family transcriptional regulator n=1 Tax=unclassified Gordonia (in: high G+C Gram-positive bacteria) TaxID=2657482 RepID=UPI001964EA9D|nr:TetR/AcrR family transcriptional regulator [Gordonia sp. PDNC005]QRY63230.1 TetR/AcrR family transcriptional regulator [Gordonia sp. PDNC005]